MPGFQAIERVDANYVVRWIVPMAGNEAAKDLDLSFEERRRRALEAARAKRLPTMSQSIDLVQGGKGFIVYVPIFLQDTFQGFILGVFRMGSLIGEELAASSPGLMIQELDTRLYGSELHGPTATRKLDIHGNSWQLYIAGEEPDDSAVVYRNIIVTFGILLALLMGTAVRLGQTARQRAEDAERATRELRTQESALRAARDAAEEANRVKSEFLANMSHEIRTPMNGVLCFTELLLGTAITPTQEEYLRVVQTSADSLLTVINDILDFSQIEAGELRLHPVPFSLRDTIISTTAIFGSHARKKSLNLRCKLPDDLPPTVLGDADRLRQVLVNLVGNAIKFTQEGSVTLSVEAKSTDSHVDLSIAVTDTGLGIDESQMSLIFEAFTQVDGSLTRAFNGTGLGLAISQHVAQMMGGKIIAESTLGQGSTFRVLLRFPIVDTPLPTERPGPSQSSAAAKTTVLLPEDRPLRVLLAEDNPINQMLTRSLLRLYNISVTLAESGPDVLASWRDGRFDLILMDVQLPAVNGLDVTRQIREDEAQNGGHIPIIALTARAMKGDREECLAAGMDDYLAKPFTREQLINAVNRQLGTALDYPGSNEQPTAAGRDLSSMRTACDDLLLLRRMVTVFLRDTPRQIAELSQGVKDEDAGAVGEFAHLLCGSCHAFALTQLADVARALEMCARKHELAEAAPHLNRLLADFATLEERLCGWLSATAP